MEQRHIHIEIAFFHQMQTKKEHSYSLSLMILTCACRLEVRRVDLLEVVAGATGLPDRVRRAVKCKEN